MRSSMQSNRGGNRGPRIIPGSNQRSPIPIPPPQQQQFYNNDNSPTYMPPQAQPHHSQPQHLRHHHHPHHQQQQFYVHPNPDSVAVEQMSADPQQITAEPQQNNMVIVPYQTNHGGGGQETSPQLHKHSNNVNNLLSNVSQHVMCSSSSSAVQKAREKLKVYRETRIAFTDAYDKSLDEIDRELQQKDEVNRRLLEKMQRLESTHESEKQRWTAKTQSLESEVAKLKAELSSSKKNSSSLAGDLEARVNELKDAQRQIEIEIKKRLDLASDHCKLSTAHEGEKQKNDNLLREKEEYETMSKRLQSEVRKFLQQIKQLDAELKNVKTENEKRFEEIKKLAQEKKELRHSVELLEAAVEKEKDESKKLQQTNEELRQDGESLKKQIEEKTGKISGLEVRIKEYKRFTRRLVTAANTLKKSEQTAKRDRNNLMTLICERNGEASKTTVDDGGHGNEDESSGKKKARTATKVKMRSVNGKSGFDLNTADGDGKPHSQQVGESSFQSFPSSSTTSSNPLEAGSSKSSTTSKQTTSNVKKTQSVIKPQQQSSSNSNAIRTPSLATSSTSSVTADNRPYQHCPTCQQTFPSRDNLKTHKCALLQTEQQKPSILGGQLSSQPSSSHSGSGSSPTTVCPTPKKRPLME